MFSERSTKSGSNHSCFYSIFVTFFQCNLSYKVAISKAFSLQRATFLWENINRLCRTAVRGYPLICISQNHGSDNENCTRHSVCQSVSPSVRHIKG